MPACPRWIQPRRLRFALILLPILLASTAHGQGFLETAGGSGAGSQPQSQADDAAVSLQQQRAAVAKQRDELQARIDAAGNDATPDENNESMLWQLEVLKYLDLLFAQRQGVEQRKEELRDEKQQLQEELDLLRSAGPPESKPYSFLRVDELRDDLSMETGRVETVHEEIAAAQRLAASVEAKYKEAEKQRRQAQEECNAAADGPEKRALLAHCEMAKLQSRVMREATGVREQEVEAARQKQVVAQIRHELLKEKLAVMSEDVVFSSDDLKARLASLANDEREIRTAVSEAQTELTEVEKRWLISKERREEAGSRTPGVEEEFQARQLERELQLETIALLNQRLVAISLATFAWDLRYRSVNGLIPASELADKMRELNSFRERRSQMQDLLEIRVRELRLELSTLDKHHSNAKQQDSPSAQWLGHQVQQTQKLIGVIATNLVRLDAAGRLLQKTATDMGERDSIAGTGHLAQIGAMWETCWTYEIAAVDDRPITVGKLVLGFIFLLVGYAVSRLLSGIIGRRVFGRLGLGPGAANALQVISFYLMLTIFGFLSLEMANVPLTVFTFLGGAVAIGVGFGSQNLMNNFISGLILLAERPVRVGDLVDIQGVNGTVEKIGARSTRVRSGANLEIIVPNSTFLENKVTNWTLSNTQIRIMVAVGVAYGSPTRTVTQLLRQTVAENADVLTNPEPLILFKEFGDNSLNFEVHFWVHMRTIMDGERVASEVRHRIDDLFSDADITIAYPQRDVHLDTLKPIEVNLRQVASDPLPAFGSRDAA